MFRHTGKRPHICEHCDAGFFRRKEMQKHLDKEHPNQNVSETVSAVPNEHQPEQSNSKAIENVSDFSSVEVFPNYMNL